MSVISLMGSYSEGSLIFWTKKQPTPLSDGKLSLGLWVQIPLNIFFWAFFATALVASQLRRSLCINMIYIVYTSHSLHMMGQYKLNSLLTCFQRGFIVQLVEHRTAIAEDPVEAWEFVHPLHINCEPFTSILYPQCIHMIYIIYTPLKSARVLN